MATMGMLTGVLRVLSDFGDAAGWLIAALVLFAYGRRIIAENEKAHKELTKNVQDLDAKIDTVAKDLDAKIDTVAKDLDTKIDTVAKDLDARINTVDARIDTVAQTLAAVARDVSFLAGRQAERDRATEA